MYNKTKTLELNFSDKFNVKCHHAVYLYIYKASYEYTKGNAELYIEQVKIKQSNI